MFERRTLYITAFLRAVTTSLVGVLLGVYLARLNITGAAFGGIAARFLGLRGPFILSAISMVGCAIIGRRLLRPVDIAVNEMQQSQSA